MDNTGLIVKVLEKFWPKNKAKGLLAQTVFTQETVRGVFGTDGKDKIAPGCWLIAPKSPDFYKFRFSFFIHPRFLNPEDVCPGPKEILGEKFRPFHAIAEFMNNAGIGVIYVVPCVKNGKPDINKIRNDDFSGIQWQFLCFQNGEFIPVSPAEFFGKWPGDRGAGEPRR